MYPTRFFGDSSLKIERQLTSQDPLAKESIGLLKSQANLLSAHKSSGEMRCTSVHLLKSESSQIAFLGFLKPSQFFHASS